MQVLKNRHRAPILLLYNYYKSWTPGEIEDG